MPPIIVTLSKSLRRAPKGGIRHDATNKMYGGGQFVPAALWEQQKQAGKDGLAPLLAETGDALQFLRLSYQQNAALQQHLDLAQQLKIPTIPLTTVEARLKATIRAAYEQAFLLGKRTGGNLTGVTPDDAKALLKVRRDEYKYLKGFMADMKAGAGVMDYGRRMEYYANAVKEAYWLGFVRGDSSPTRRIEWRMGETLEKCQTCVDMAAKGPMTMAEFLPYVRRQILPQSGALICKGRHCQCRLVDAAAE